MLRGDCAIEGGENVLSSDSVTCSAGRSEIALRNDRVVLTSFIEYDRQELVGMFKQGEQDAHFRDRVVGTTCWTTS